MSGAENFLRFLGGLGGGDNALMRTADAMNPEVAERKRILQERQLARDAVLNNPQMLGQLSKIVPNAGEYLQQGGSLEGLGDLRDILSGAELPSAVREYEYFANLPDKQSRDEYLKVKRADQLRNMGNVYGVYDQLSSTMRPAEGGNIAPSPAQQDEIDRKNREAEDMFNRGLDVKQKALEATQRLIGVYNPETEEYEGGNESGVRANRGGVSTLFPNVGDSAVDAAADLETLSNLLTTENLGLLKGVLSDTDMKILASIGSGELQGSDEKTLGAIRRMQEALSGKVAAGRQVQQQGFDEMPPLLSDPKLSLADDELTPEEEAELEQLRREVQ